jgi:hypothetical protein
MRRVYLHGEGRGICSLHGEGMRASFTPADERGSLQAEINSHGGGRGGVTNN